MGISTKTIAEITCDLCGAECSAFDGAINIRVNSGDGRDVGPATLTAVFRLDQPYGVQGGIIFRACKFKWLRPSVAPNRGTWKPAASWRHAQVKEPTAAFLLNTDAGEPCGNSEA